jgi:HEPN domain-containing protein
MPDEIALARGWFLKVESDFLNARRTLDSHGPYDTACFHAQQVAGKYIKGLLVLHRLLPPRSHDLEELQLWVESTIPGWPLAGLDLADITPCAVQMRYDLQLWLDRETAGEAVRVATEVRNRVVAAVPQAARPDRWTETN